jgi:glycosyltransferase involved in cell wall biosynthesis
VTAKPLVSAIVPTYNRADTVGQAVESILGQTYKNIEVIVVDDGSTDGTHDVLQRFGSRLRIFRQENAGPSAARNRGIAAAQGEMIAFLDSDDTWLSEKIERQTRLLSAADRSVPCCICNATIRAANGPDGTSFQSALLDPAVDEGLWLNVAQVLIGRFLLFSQAVLIRRSALDRVGGFDENLRYLEDYDLALRLSSLGPWAFTRELLLIYHKGTTGSLAAEALQKASRLGEYEVQIRGRAWESIKDGDPHLGREMRAGLMRARRRLKTARMAEAQTWGAATAYRLARYAEHYRNAFVRRSPWFPKMKTTSLPRLTANSSGEQEPVCSVRVGAGSSSDREKA